MGTREKIVSTKVFKAALIFSSLLFFSFWFRQELWSAFWLLYGFIFLGIVVAFAVTMVWSLVFWIRKGKEYKAAFTPLMVTVLSLGIIVSLPITEIKNKLWFSSNKTRMEEAVKLILKDNPKRTKYPSTVKLPKKYELLSAGGGEVIIANTHNSRAVLFYTFRGVPDGISGFLNIVEDGEFEDFKNQFNILKYKELGNNWYFVSGE